MEGNALAHIEPEISVQWLRRHHCCPDTSSTLERSVYEKAMR